MFSISGRDLAIDLGTSNTLVYVRGKGVVVNEPSVVALKQKGKRRTPIAFGAEAKNIWGKAPENVVVVRPVRAGVISDFDTTSIMLNHFLKSALKSHSFIKPQVVVTVPGSISEVEKRAIRDSIEGTASIKLLDEAMAAAYGAGLPVNEPTASMIVDIGGGTTDVAVISMGQVVCSESASVGGEAMDESIIDYIRRHHQFIIGETTAENVKKTLGATIARDDSERVEIKGFSVTKGIPATTVVTGEEIRLAIQKPLAGIISTIRRALEKTPPELAGDVMSIGLVLVGGGSLLRGIDYFIENELQIRVRVSEDPFGALAIGAGKCLDMDFMDL